MAERGEDIVEFPILRPLSPLSDTASTMTDYEYGAPNTIDLEVYSTATRVSSSDGPSKDDVKELLSETLEKLLRKRGETFNSVKNYLDLFNSWYNAVPVVRSTYTTKMDTIGKERVYTVTRFVAFRCRGPDLTYSHSEKNTVTHVAAEAVAKRILSMVRVVKVQMDSGPSKESVQGDATQQSEKSGNTIITRDQDITESLAGPDVGPKLEEVSSSEPMHDFGTLVNRWMPVPVIPVSVNDEPSKILARYFVPESFVQILTPTAPNTLPFESFVYGQYDVEMNFVVNANKFHCGKVLVDVKFDSYQADMLGSQVETALTRRHIILDLSSNNEGKIQVPYRFRRTFIRNSGSNNSVGVRPLKYATVTVQVLSSLRTGPGGSNGIEIRPFYRFTRADFAGMSYKVPLTQMEGLAGGALAELIRPIERMFHQRGRSYNQDKPTDNRAAIVIPKPRLHFPNAKGLSDATVMRADPSALTAFKSVAPTPDEPRTTLDIARIWGLYDRFEWNASNTEGQVLYSTVVDPMARSYTKAVTTTFTPLEYVASFYQFWSGPIEVRLDFVSNSFHTGAVMISAEFNRQSSDTSEAQSHCTYTKTFHLGDQKSVAFRIPYIYDTVMRRSTNPPFDPLLLDGREAGEIEKQLAMGLRPESSTTLKVRVINALRPVAAASQAFEVLVYMRAGRNFYLHGLCQSSLTEPVPMPMDSFPADGYNPVKPSGVLADEEGDLHMQHLPESPNKYNEVKPIPSVQMDTGEKENEDPTQDFSHGVSSRGLVSSDDQVGIKDILRRPTLIVHRADMTADFQHFIPLMPPSKMWQAKPTDWKYNPTTALIGMTPTARIMDLFRFWRGSMRYTVIVEPNTDPITRPVYITHVPHSGVRMLGLQRVNSVLVPNQPIYGCGLTTEILLPSVNPSATIEVPYDTENNWTLTFEEDTERNYAWRDKGDTTSGHLVISAAEPLKVTVWWSAGDDFEVANFYGPRNLRQSGALHAYSDAYARVQMETQSSGFSLANASTSVSALASSVRGALGNNVVRAALYSVPFAGPAAALSDGMQVVDDLKRKAEEVAEHVTDSVDRALNVGKATVADARESMKEAASGMRDAVADAVKLMVSKIEASLTPMGLATDVLTHCYHALFDIVIALYDKSWFAIGVGIVRFVGVVLGKMVSAEIFEYASRLGRAFEALCTPTQQVPRVQAPDQTSTVVGVLAGLVGTMLGVKLNPGRYNYYFLNLLDRMTSTGGASYLVTVIRYVDATFTTLKNMILHALGYSDPQAEALQMLSGASDVVSKFVSEAQIMSSEANSALMHDPGFRQRFWAVVMQAYQIQKLIASVPASHVSPVVSKLCNDVIRIGNEKFVDISSAPVRYEPFVICIEGSAGIGKSEMVEALVAQLLRGIELTRPHSGATYYRMPGSSFWSGYRDQPVVVYDDWMNLTDPTLVAQQLGELYQLKSTSLFIPPMAHLEEKKIRGNPLIVIMLCNNAFPDSAMNNIAHTKEAIYRRRDVLLYAKRKKEYEGVNLRDMSVEEQRSFAHLEFQRYIDPATRKKAVKTVNYPVMEDWLVSKFKRWHAQEQIKVKRRLELAQIEIAEGPVRSIRLEDPFSLYYNVSAKVSSVPENSQNAFLPSEILAAEVLRIAQAVELHQEVIEEIIPPEEPKDPFTQASTDIGPSEPKPCTAKHYQTLNEHYSAKEIMKRFTEQILDIANGVVINRIVLRDVILWTRQQLAALAARLFGQSRGACGYCRRLKPRFLSCYKQRGPTGHSICKDCYTETIEERRPNLCPQCNSSDLRMSSLHDAIVELTMLGRLLRAGLITVDQLAKYCEEFIYGFYSTPTTAVAAGLASVATNVAVDAKLAPGNTATWSRISSFLTGSSISLLLNGMDHLIGITAFNDPHELRRRAERFMEQVQRPMEAEVEEIPQPAVEHVPEEKEEDKTVRTQAEFDPFGDDDEPLTSDVAATPYIDFDPKRVEDLCRSIVQRGPDTQCHHDDLLRVGPAGVLYSNGVFIIRASGRRITENPCWEACPLTNYQRVLTFYQAYFEGHNVGIQGKAKAYVDVTCLTRREMIALSIPKAIRPRWMVPKAVVEAQAASMCIKKWWTALSDSYTKHATAWKTLIAVIGGMGAAFAAYKTWAYLFSQEPRTRTQYAVASGDDCTRNMPKQDRSLKRPSGSRTHFQAEDPSLDEVVVKYIARNYIAFDIHGIDGEIMRTLIGVGMCGRCALMPRHYVKALRKFAREGYKIMLGPATSVHERNRYNFDEADFLCSPHTDLARFKCPPSYGMFKDIRKFVVTEEDLTRSITPEACIVLAPTVRHPTLTRQNIEIFGFQQSEIVEDADGERFEAYDVLAYGYSRSGACGSLVLLENTQRPIIALHFAGVGSTTQGEGYGVILTQESIQDALTSEVVTQMEEPELEDLEEAKFIFPADVNVSYLGALTPEETVFIPKKTKIRPSLIQGVCNFQPQTFPCILDKSDPRYQHQDTPLFAGARKHGVCTTDFQSSQIARAKEALWSGWLSTMRPAVLDPKRLTPEEAATGFPGVDYYDPMVLDTSAGYPYVLRKKKQKSDYVTFQRNEQLQPIGSEIDPEVLKKLEADTAKRRMGMGVFTPFIDTLKDERRKKEKLMKYGGTRVFCNPPVEFVLATRQNLLHFTAAFMKQRLDLQHAVGINATGTEWTQLATRLIRKSPNNIVTIDYSNFGPGFNAGVAQAAADLMVQWTMAHVGGVDKVEIEALLAECVNSVHICNNLVYRQKCGSPSGAPITTIINSLVNQLLILLAWEGLAQSRVKERGKYLWEEFRANIALFVYGDDLVMAVTDDYIDIFNGQTITSWFAKYGIVATDASKSSTVKSHVPITEAEFLKRRFQRHPTREHMWLAPLSWTSIQDCSQWIWQCADKKEATVENCRAALISAHGHGPHAFDQLKTELNRALVLKKCQPLLITWEELDNKFFDTAG